jgi:uncharacterized protein YfcZ (UPF0381/DUF406 family)
MQVNLRKANAIQAEIRKAISAVKLELNVAVTEYTVDISAGLAAAELSFITAIQRKEALNKVLFNIRTQVGKANTTSGISDVLAEVQRVDAVLTIVGTVANAAEAKPLSEITARIEKMKANVSTDARTALYGERYNNVETSVVTQQMIAQYKTKMKELKREKQALQDKLLTLNVGTNITLDAGEVDLLKDEGIL